jgi:hypothetical protein
MRWFKIFTVVGKKSGTVAIDVHFHSERAVCQCKTYFRFRFLQQNELAITLQLGKADQTRSS